MRHLGMGLSEIHDLPITYRHWFINRVVEDFESKANARKNSQPSSRAVTVDVPFGAMNKES